MATRQDVRGWVREAIKANGGSATLIEVAEHIWSHHEGELRASGRLFYTWQYVMRWAAHDLRKASVLKSADESPKGVWELA